MYIYSFPAVHQTFMNLRRYVVYTKRNPDDFAAQSRPPAAAEPAPPAAPTKLQ